MAEIPAATRLICSGCNRNFDSADDLAPAQVGTVMHTFCRRCYVTGLGATNPIDFTKAKELAGQTISVETPVVTPGAVASARQAASVRRG